MYVSFSSEQIIKFGHGSRGRGRFVPTFATGHTTSQKGLFSKWRSPLRVASTARRLVQRHRDVPHALFRQSISIGTAEVLMREDSP